MTWRLAVRRGVWFGILLLMSFAATVGLLTMWPGSGTAEREQPPPPPLALDDVVPVRDLKDGKLLGWQYIPSDPEDPPEPTPLPAHLQEAIARGERVVYEERPGVTVTIEKGEVSVLIDAGRADPLHREPWESPIFATREEAESYAATRRPH